MKFSELELAFEFVSSAEPGMNQAFLERDTGVIHWHSEYGDNEAELPEDIAADRFVEIPHKKDLDLGKPLALRFAELHLRDRHSQVQAIFSGPGAYARFKDLLEHDGKLKAWHAFEEQEGHAALRNWCLENGIDVDG